MGSCPICKAGKYTFFIYPGKQREVEIMVSISNVYPDYKEFSGSVPRIEWNKRITSKKKKIIDENKIKKCVNRWKCRMTYFNNLKKSTLLWHKTFWEKCIVIILNFITENVTSTKVEHSFRHNNSLRFFYKCHSSW